jgi:Amidohydrolase family
LFITVASLVALTILVATNGIVAAARRWRKNPSRRSATLSRARILVLVAWLLALIGALIAAFVLPGGPLFDSLALRVVFTLGVVLSGVASATALVLTVTTWRDPGTAASRWHTVFASISGITVAAAGLVFWVPIAWRSSDSGIEELAQRIRDSGIVVQTTLVNYDALGGPGRLRLVNDPAINYLLPETRSRWRQAPEAGPPGYRYTEFMKKVVGTLHRAGVPLMAGTDAMGMPLVAPGSSLHHELELLVASGLTPYEAIRTATVVPAGFLGKETEFGSVTEGSRADLLLIDGNPLEDVTRLRKPLGVMVRGKWFAPQQLGEMLALLEQQRSGS